MLILVAVIVLLTTLSLFLVYKITMKNTAANAPTYGYDYNAVDAEKPEDYSNTQEYLNAIADKTKMAVSKIDDLEFENGTSSTSTNLTNSDTNILDLQIVIINQDTEEVLYTSDLIKPGKSIQTIKLDTSLEKGSYKCIAYSIGVDDSTKNAVGQAGTLMNINIKS